MYTGIYVHIVDIYIYIIFIFSNIYIYTRCHYGFFLTPCHLNGERMVRKIPESSSPSRGGVAAKPFFEERLPFEEFGGLGIYQEF